MSRPIAEPSSQAAAPSHAAFPGFTAASPPHRRSSAGAAIGAPHSPSAVGGPGHRSLSPRLTSSGLFADDLSGAAAALRPQRWSSPGAVLASRAAGSGSRPLLHAALRQPLSASTQGLSSAELGASQASLQIPGSHSDGLHLPALPGARGDLERLHGALGMSQPAGPASQAMPGPLELAWSKGSQAAWPQAALPLAAPPGVAASAVVDAASPRQSAALRAAAAGACPEDELLRWSRLAAEAANAGLPEPPYPPSADVPDLVRAWHDSQRQPLVPVVRWALLNLQGLIESRSPDYPAFVAALDRATRDALSRRNKNLPLVSLHELFSLPLRLPTIVFAARQRRVSVGGSLPPLHAAEQPPPRTTVVSCLVCKDEGTEQVTADNIADIFRTLPPYASTAGIPELAMLLRLRHCPVGARSSSMPVQSDSTPEDDQRAAAASGPTAAAAAASAPAPPHPALEHDLNTREGATAAAEFLLKHLPGASTASQGPVLSMAPMLDPAAARLRPPQAAGGPPAHPHAGGDAAQLADIQWLLRGASFSQGSALTAAAGRVPEQPAWAGARADAEQPVRAAIDLLGVVNPQKRASERSGGSTAHRVSVMGASEGGAGSGARGPARRLAVNLLENISPAPSGHSSAVAGPAGSGGVRGRGAPPLPPLPPLHPVGPPPRMTTPSETLAVLQQALREGWGDGSAEGQGRGPRTS